MAYATDHISHIGGAGKDAYTYYPVVVIGAGESGICMGARLQQVLGFDQFRIFERRAQLGGTWYTNTYPGIACDVPAVLYSFSFAQNPKWTAAYPSGPEIVKYLYDVCSRFKLLDKIQCDTNVKSARWVEADEQWEVVLEHLAPGIGDMSTAERKAVEKAQGVEAAVLRLETIRAKVVVSAVGGLVEPKPNLDLPGIDTFEGQIVHTARWDANVDLKDKNVALVGTGCSAAQVAASIVKPEYGIKSLTQLLRSPPWVIPALPNNETFNRRLRFLCTYVPGFQELIRQTIFYGAEWDFISHFPNTGRARKGRKAKAKELTRYLEKAAPKQYHEILTPNYEVFCKRRVIDDGWYKSLHDDRVEIISQPLTAVGAKSITVGPGRYHPPIEDTNSTAPTERREISCDVLIMGNGFATNEWLHPLDVAGKGGKSLYETWKERGGAQAYLGTAMDGFPNFFIIFGPNTATGHTSVIVATENAVNYSLKFIEPILKGEVRAWDVKESAERKWTADLQKDLAGTVFNSGGARNWYVSQGSGWNSSTYPRTQIDLTLRCMFPSWSHWNATYTRKGLLLLWMRRLYKTAIFLATIVGVGYIYKHGRVAFGEKSFELVSMIKPALLNVLKKAGVAS